MKQKEKNGKERVVWSRGGEGGCWSQKSRKEGRSKDSRNRLKSVWKQAKRKNAWPAWTSTEARNRMRGQRGDGSVRGGGKCHQMMEKGGGGGKGGFGNGVQQFSSWPWLSAGNYVMLVGHCFMSPFEDYWSCMSSHHPLNHHHHIQPAAAPRILPD